MKKFVSVFCFLAIVSNVCFGQNWIRIHDAMIDHAKIITINNKRTLFFQTFGLTGAPFIGCNDSTIYRTYKLNSLTNNTYKPYGSFLEPFICTDFFLKSCMFYRPDEYDVSNFDSSFVIKYFQSMSGSNCTPPHIRKIITSTGYVSPGDTLSAKVIRISPFNDNNIYSLINNYLFRSTDRGQNWSYVSGTPGNLRDVILNLYDSNYVYLLSHSQDSMLISLNGGVSFDVIAINFSSSSSLYFKSKDTLLTYNASNLYKSGNKGLSWSLAGTGPGNFNCLEFHPALKNIYYAGFDNLGLYVSTNKGVVFSLYNTFTPSNHVYAVLKARPDKDSIYVVTSRGVYVAYDSYVTKITQTTSAIPDKFKLYNNYPNPFNPSTKINFDISQGARGEMQDVRLVVFDIIGKEIITLVNQKLSAGSYSVVFDASNYPSGVYYYKLEAGNFSEVKKMILIK